MRKVVTRQLLALCPLLFVLCIVPAFLFAAEFPKIGCVDLQKIVYESETGKKAKSDLDALVKSKQSIVDEKLKAIERLKGEIEKQASVLSPEARKSKQEELEKMEREYLRFAQDSEAEIRKKDAELKDMILKEVFELIEKIGKEEGYTLIIERSTAVYFDNILDITDKVIKKYNELKTRPKKK
ncbi:MAG: OmpH family outer membrane protein [Nitrospirota bacterium]